jgi:hypothetical protein
MKAPVAKRRWRRVGAAALVVAVVSTATALASDSQRSVVPYPAGGQTLYGLRPTAVGLPQVGESGTVGVNALAPSLRAYHDSGAYENDLAAIDSAAKSYVDQRLTAARTRRQVCVISYQRVPPIPGQGTLYRRVRRCRTERLSGKPAIVLDIDETSLSNYADLSAANFDVSALALSAVAGHGTAVQPTLTLYKHALARGVAVFFVTGRPAAIDSITKSNLRSAGYDMGWAGVYEKPASTGTERFKSSTRAAIQKRGYDIIANIGDQQSDLDGGHADRDFKLPDPFYFISD